MGHETERPSAISGTCYFGWEMAIALFMYRVDAVTTHYTTSC